MPKKWQLSTGMVATLARNGWQLSSGIAAVLLRIMQIRELKQRHPFKIVNSFDGLRLLGNDKWERPVWSSIVVNDGQLSPCCCRAGISDAEVCRNCGCSPAVETYALQNARPFAVLEWLRFM